jgi:dephospho-CoA kinase
MIVGLAGKVCSGKSSLAEVFVRRGFLLVNADQLGHEVLEQERAQLRERFGVLATPEGQPVDRAYLAARVFSDQKALKDLEAIVHPGVLARVQRILAQAGARPVLLEAAVLHRGGLLALCDAVVWVQAPWWKRFWRARRRDRRSWKVLLAREWSQRTFSIKAFLRDVDTYIVDNGKDLEAARQSLELLLDRLENQKADFLNGARQK